MFLVEAKLQRKKGEKSSEGEKHGIFIKSFAYILPLPSNPTADYSFVFLFFSKQSIQSTPSCRVHRKLGTRRGQNVQVGKQNTDTLWLCVCVCV